MMLKKSPWKNEIQAKFTELEAEKKLGNHFSILLREMNPLGRRPLILLAIGTDRATGDCLGPLVGSFIKQLDPGFFPVYGTLEEPVHALNLQETLTTIRKNFGNPLIIAVDASLGKAPQIGVITLGKGHLCPGSSVRKNLPPIGEIFVHGVVNVGGFMEYLVLQSTRLNLVMKMANCIARSLVCGYRRYSNSLPITSMSSKK